MEEVVDTDFIDFDDAAAIAPITALTDWREDHGSKTSHAKSRMNATTTA